MEDVKFYIISLRHHFRQIGSELFFQGMIHSGGSRQEFSQLIGSNLLAGLRLALP